MHRFVLHNDDVHDSQIKDTSPGQTGLMNGWGVFSTMRVASGVLFAFERHWARMQHDAKRLRVPFPSTPDYIETRLHRLIEANHAHDATLRVVVVRNRGGPYEGPELSRDFDLIAFTTGLSDWGDSVRLTIKPNARHAANEFAGAKIMSWACNLTWYEEAHERGFDEVVLLNEHGEVCECTSANIFTAIGNDVFTPPLSSGCLPGVTRELLVDEVRVPGIRVIEKTLAPIDLEKADGVFITSSTRDLLPVVSVEGLRIREDSRVMNTLREALVHYREEYVRKKAISGAEPVYNR